MSQNILIDKEFQALIPPLSAEEKQPSKYQLGVEAIRLMTVEKDKKNKRKAAKKLWIEKARAIFNPGEKQPCIVCGKYKSVAHAHHLTPLHTQYDKPTFSEEFVWLCPTHHDGVHRLIDGKQIGNWPSMDGFTVSEQLEMARIAAMGD